MASKTRMTALVRALDVAAADADLAGRPDLLTARDERGRTWLHLCAMVEVGDDPAKVAASLAMAEMLLARGLDLDDAAFTEGANGEWRATPLWHAISRGQNLALATLLLERGCDPDHCLFAAAWNSDIAAIRLLIAHGASLSGQHVLDAVGWSRFAAVEEFLRQGADVNAVGKDGRTALHMMLKKDSAIEYLRMVAGFGARGDIPNADGRTVTEILARKRDPAFKALAAELLTSPARRREGDRPP